MELKNFHCLWRCALMAIDKPKGITSAKLVNKIKTIILANLKSSAGYIKFGHGGTLDCSSTGVLAVGTGDGCKMLTEFLKGRKEYLVTGILGIQTTTLNEDGMVVNEMPYSHVTQDMLLEACQQFIGDNQQIPPEYSAIKIGGNRLSDLKVSGKKMILYPRLVKCFSIELKSFHPPQFVLEVKCGSGFYIRSLVRDIGSRVGSCANVLHLRRMSQGFLNETDSVSDFSYNNLHNNASKISKMPQFAAILEKYYGSKQPRLNDTPLCRYLRQQKQNRLSIVFSSNQY